MEGDRDWETLDKEYRDRLQDLDKLIVERDNLKSLTQQESWKTLMEKLAEMRVDAMDLAIAEGDTTEAKAYARALGTILNFFYSLANDTAMKDLEERKKQLREEIDMVEKDRMANQYPAMGLNATL